MTTPTVGSCRCWRRRKPTIAITTGVATVIFLIGVSTIGRSVGTDDVLVRIKGYNNIKGLLGVGQSTVPERLKSLSNKREDSSINSSPNNRSVVHGGKVVIYMSSRKLRSIHKTTGGSKNGIRLAKLTVEHDLTIQAL